MANSVRCPNGHFYDSARFQACPFCGIPAGASMPPPMPMMQPPVQPMPMMQQPPVQPIPMQPQPMMQPAPFQPPLPGFYPSQNPPAPVQERNQTPVVGWLVCISGSSYGKTYPIRENKNYIGRSASMDIRIENDHSVSREKHGVITYVPKKRTFLAMPGESRELYYVNDDVVLDTVELHKNDKIEIGKSLLLFVPLCGENFAWDVDA